METDKAIYELLHNQFFNMLTSKMLRRSDVQPTSETLNKMLQHISIMQSQTQQLYDSTVADLIKMTRINIEDIFDIFNANTPFMKYVVLCNISQMIVDAHLQTNVPDDSTVYSILSIFKNYLEKETFITNFVTSYNYKIITNVPKPKKNCSYIKKFIIVALLGVFAGGAYRYYNTGYQIQAKKL